MFVVGVFGYRRFAQLIGAGEGHVARYMFSLFFRGSDRPTPISGPKKTVWEAPRMLRASVYLQINNERGLPMI